MKAKELRQLTKEELQSRIVDLKRELMKINTQTSTGTAVKESGQIKRIRRTIARILTVIKDMEESKKYE